MTLIKCKECGKDIAETATRCPSCGKPNIEEPMLVQLTSKKWKTFILIGWVMIIIGVFFFISGSINGIFSTLSSFIGFYIAFLGLIPLAIGKIGAWWQHS